MATTAHTTPLEEKIADLIEEAYLEHGWSVFIPEQFVDSGLGSAEDVVLALRNIETEGGLEGWAQVVCANNHVIWEGRAAAARLDAPRECPIATCDTAGDDDEDAQPWIKLRYKIAPFWKRLLEKKKRPRRTA